MQAVILAAGEGARMRPLTETKPKVMLPIAGKPILEHLLCELKEAGFREFTLIVGYHDEAVRRYFGNGERWGVRIGYLSQRRQLGTAHALGIAQGFTGDRFLMINGDVLVPASDIKGLLAQEPPALGVVEVDDAEGMGTVVLEGGRVLHIYEKMKSPPSHLANSGVYLLRSEIFPAVAKTSQSPRGEYELTDSLQILIDEGHLVSYQKLEHWFEASYPWDLLSANESLLKGLEPQNQGVVEENVVLKGTVRIGRGTVIHPNSYIIGPVVIGEDCEVGPNCYIRPSTAIGDDCHIGNSVEVKNSIIMSGTKLPHHNYIGDSIIGEDCNLGAGTKIANLRLDKGDIAVGGLKTGRRKLGAIIGDGVQTGINASINAGSLIGSNTFIGPGAVASGVILSGSRIF